MTNPAPQKFRVVLSILLTTVFTLGGLTQAQPKAEDRPQTEDARVARLAGLGRVWGAVKFFHPYLAYREIDWDRALIETIPRVNAAKSPAEYNEAIHHLLSFLHDKNTTAEIYTEAKSAPSATEKIDSTNLVRVEDGVLTIEVFRIAEALAQDNSRFNLFGKSINTSLPQAKAIVLNCRSKTEIREYGEYFFDLFARRALPLLLDSDVTLGTSRYRLHNGYAPQMGTSSGGYYSAFVETSPQTITGQSKTKSLPIAVIINEKTPNAAGEIFSGLQASKRALIVQEGAKGSELGVATHVVKLPDEVRVRMRTTELINPDGSIGFEADLVVPENNQADDALAAALKSLQQSNTTSAHKRNATGAGLRSLKDKPYTEMEFPNVEYRLLALFQFWNVINYFFPYKHLIDDPWEKVLPRYIPKFEANKDTLEYQTMMYELATETHDSHVGVRNATKFFEKLGDASVPVQVQMVEKQTVVTAVLDEKAGVKVGDVILAIDDEPIERRRAHFERLLPASTPQSRAVKVNDSLLLGPKDSSVKLLVRGMDGNPRETVVSRSLSANDLRLYQTTRRGPVVHILPSGFGYVDLARLQPGEVNQMFETLKHTPAIVFDMRGYPNGTAWEIAPRLTEKKNITGAVFSRPILEATGLSDGQLANTSFSFRQILPPAKGDVYKGKVVMLINEDAISQSEHTCLFFEAATDVTFVGTPTTGANGDITTMVLPGNLVVSFSGHDVRHADGRQLQRLGIQPHIYSAPTIRGLVEGRDEVLEAAVKFLQEKLSKR